MNRVAFLSSFLPVHRQSLTVCRFLPLNLTVLSCIQSDTVPIPQGLNA